MTIDWAQLAAVAAVMVAVAAGIRFMIAKMLADFKNDLRGDFVSRQELDWIIEQGDETHRRIDMTTKDLWTAVNDIRERRTRPS